MKPYKTLSWCLIVCMLLILAAPILAYANSRTSVIVYNGTEIIPEIEPYENQLGVMVSAEDMAKAFSVKYDFNSKAKYFHMYTEEHGDIYLVHNATKFASGENTFECAPNFYFENGIPMVEAGFFCEMFGTEYTVSGSEIVISEKSAVQHEEQTVEDTPDRLSISDFEASSTGELSGTVYYSSGAPAGGLEIEIIFAKYKMSTFLGTYKATTLRLSKGETSKKFSINPYDVLGNDSTLNFAVGYNIPSLGLSGYLDYYGDVTHVDPATTPAYDLSRFFLYHKNNVTIDILPVTTISGTITFDKDVEAPAGGLDVTLNLVSYSDVRKSNYGYTYRSYGGQKTIGTVNLTSGAKSKNYSLSIPQPESHKDYPNYLIYYTTTTRNCVYSPAFLRTDGACEILTDYYTCPSDAQLFRFENNTKANIKLLTYKSYGNTIKGKAGDNITWNFNETSGILTLKGRGEMYDNLYHTQWRDYKTKVKSVVIEDGITYIGAKSFCYMSSLTSVSIPDSVISIGSEAFEYASALRNIELPNRLETIGSWAFCGCSLLETVTIPDSIGTSTIGTGIFTGCPSLETIYAPNKLAASESKWLGSNNAPEIVYDCNVVYKQNGKTVDAKELKPGSVINVPDAPSIPAGGKYYLTVNGKVHTGSTITVDANTVINQVVISPSSEVKSVIKCDSFTERAVNDTYNFSCSVESVSTEVGTAGSTAIVVLYDSMGRMVGIKRVAVSSDNVISGMVTGENASEYKIMIIDTETLKPSSFSCEGNLE